MSDAREIYRIVSVAEWAEARSAGVYQGAAHDRRDGFLHFSTRAQVAETLARHYAGATDLLVLTIAVDRIGQKLRWEASRGGELFPHLYGALPVAAVTGVGDAKAWRG